MPNPTQYTIFNNILFKKILYQINITIIYKQVFAYCKKNPQQNISFCWYSFSLKLICLVNELTTNHCYTLTAIIYMLTPPPLKKNKKNLPSSFYGLKMYNVSF